MPRPAHRLRLAPPMALCLAVLAAAPTGLVAQSRHPADLVLLLVIDQLRPDYLERFAKDFSGGLARLRRTGAFFPNGMQDHALTLTAPGHSTILSGRFPAHTGIVSNALGVPDTRAPLIEVRGVMGASPHRFRGTTLVDWMRAENPRTRVLSVSRKDRGAILPVGRARGDVYWFARDKFTTSTYYAAALPAWVRAYNERRGPDRLAGRVWSLSAPETVFTEPDSVPYENGGHDVTFPHRLTRSPDSLLGEIERFPWMDSLTLDFALEAMRHVPVGRGGSPDLLSVSLSTLDAIGHRYGPDSREVHDHMLRLDRWLGGFLDSLDRVVPPRRVLMVLTSDHGLATSPFRRRPPDGARTAGLWLRDVERTLAQQLAQRHQRDFDIVFEYGLLLADTTALAARGIRVDSLASALAAEVARRDGIARVYTPADLRRPAPTDTAAHRWRRSLASGHGWLFAAVLEPGMVWTASRNRPTNHGTPGTDDVRVPILFAGPRVRAGTFARPARTVDIAPTLARLLGVAPAERLDGVVLDEVVPAALRSTK